MMPRRVPVPAFSHPLVLAKYFKEIHPFGITPNRRSAPGEVKDATTSAALITERAKEELPFLRLGHNKTV